MSIQPLRFSINRRGLQVISTHTWISSSLYLSLGFSRRRDRKELPEKVELLEKQEKLEKLELPEKPEKPEKLELPEKPETPEIPEKL